MVSIVPVGKSALTALAMLAFVTASPPAPNGGVVAEPTWIWKERTSALKLVRVTCCCSLPPWTAVAIPAGVSFWPRTIGMNSWTPSVDELERGSALEKGYLNGLDLGDALQRLLNAEATCSRRRARSAPRSRAP